ncbi:MAG: hypothetical protein A3B25_02235 [Candidatus Ryanbacteria bacterium RIFCSPLOWO2_01_FULL_48_26]|uniref:NAD(P)-binding domain-containing protein n=1 Tax=Candidatus Ryanbacteria bacterium RIFCSPLOWO2_01_FULL_48_26 TaxID=1802126 RepID=A0A1G2GT98_9BACT|nr:MAG: hypothetical protein A3B25_02235 [Candidatus Ryanbacteria bacterium RIFCSPLOWO2_01_FULL_48_26]OHB23069.1 MAG: hypothetical protein A3J67_02125 [Parcubacteria group bacterium RIFCSPHIGHO2_02_FULL_48_10b]
MENFWKNKRVFVTGANGFLGSHLTKALIERGVRPFALVYEENPGSIFEQDNLAEKSHVIRGDVRDLSLMRRILRERQIDVIFHLAAQAIVDQAINDPLGTFETNIQGTWNILEAAKDNGKVGKIVVASSDKAYGQHENLPYREDIHNLKVGYPYEVSKSCADMICQSYFKTFGTPVCVTRCTNLYGPGDLKFNRIVPNTIKQLHFGKAPLVRDTGASLRDYLFVEDAALAYIKLAEKMDKTMYGEPFNFSTNAPLSVADVINLITKEIKKNISPRVVKTKGFEIRHQYSSYEKAKKLLGWEPTHDFRAGLAKTIPWYMDYLKKVPNMDAAHPWRIAYLENAREIEHE